MCVYFFSINPRNHDYVGDCAVRCALWSSPCCEKHWTWLVLPWFIVLRFFFVRLFFLSLHYSLLILYQRLLSFHTKMCPSVFSVRLSKILRIKWRPKQFRLLISRTCTRYGRSTAAGSLLLWTHLRKNITWHSSFPVRLFPHASPNPATSPGIVPPRS